MNTWLLWRSIPHLKAGQVWWAIITKPLPIAVVRVAPYDYHLILGVARWKIETGWRTSIAALDWTSYALSISSRCCARDIDYSMVKGGWDDWLQAERSRRTPISTRLVLVPPGLFPYSKIYYPKFLKKPALCSRFWWSHGSLCRCTLLYSRPHRLIESLEDHAITEAVATPHVNLRLAVKILASWEN